MGKASFGAIHAWTYGQQDQNVHGSCQEKHRASLRP